MILRLLLTLLNPYKNGRLPRRKGFWLRCRIAVFNFSVKRLQRRYRQYAYYDGINLGTVKIIHSCRDEEFEGWLKKTGMDIRPHLVSSKNYPEGEERHGIKPFYKFFEFNRQLIVYNSGKVLVINRSSQLSVNNEIKGTLNISDDTDILLRTEFKSAFKIQNTAPIKEAINTEPKKEPIKEKPPKHRDKVSLGRPTINTTPPVVEPPVVEPPVAEPPSKEETGRKMRGVEIDESF